MIVIDPFGNGPTFHVKNDLEHCTCVAYTQRQTIKLFNFRPSRLLNLRSQTPFTLELNGTNPKYVGMGLGFTLEPLKPFHLEPLSVDTFEVGDGAVANGTVPFYLLYTKSQCSKTFQFEISD